MKKHFLMTIFCVATILIPQTGLRADDDSRDQKSKCPDCGVVTAIQVMENSGGSGLGAAAGALAGGLLGNQAGKTETASSTIGGTVSTILGVAGGALSGHYAEKALGGAKEWNVTVRMNNGETRAITMKSEPTVKSGDQVRIAEGSVVRYQEMANKKSAEKDDDDDEKKNDD